MKQKAIGPGHNRPPRSLDEMINGQDRVRINKEVMTLLKPIPDPNGEKYLERVINDTDVIGFKAKANTGGSRSYFYQYTPKGRDEEKTKAARDRDPAAKVLYLNPVKIHLGKFYERHEFEKKGLGTTPAVARKMAIEIRDAIKVGKDPFAIMASRRKAKTLSTIYDEFMKNRIKPGHLKKKSISDMVCRKKVWIDLNSSKLRNKQIRMQHKAALSIGRMKMIELEKDDYVRFHHAVTFAGKYQANRCIEDLRLLEGYAKEKGYIKETVCHFKKKELNREVKRMEVEDPYDLAELMRLRRALLKIAKQEPISFSSCLALLALPFIGNRGRSEIFNLNWDQVNMPKREIRYFDTKNNEPLNKSFGITPAAVFRIMLRIRFATNPRNAKYRYVFPTSRKNSKFKHISDPRKVFKKACKIAGVKVKPLHFLRHSWATIAAEATGDIEAVRVMGGWKSLNSVMVYVKFLKRREKAAIKKVDKFMRSHAK